MYVNKHYSCIQMSKKLKGESALQMSKKLKGESALQMSKKLKGESALQISKKLKGESALHTILLSHIEGSYCTRGGGALENESDIQVPAGERKKGHSV